MRSAVLFSLALLIASCSSVPSPSPEPEQPITPVTPVVDPAPQGDAGTTPKPPPVEEKVPAFPLDGARLRRAEQLTSLFENGTIKIRYDYVEDLGDGRGYTVGRAGFTTANGDLHDVVVEYTKTVPDNALAEFEPELERLYLAVSSDTSGLDGFEDAWVETSADPKQRAAQDLVVKQLYYTPAMKICDQVGLVSPLARAAMYDTLIQHGNGTDLDSVNAIVLRTNAAVALPKDGLGEAKWLRAFLVDRRATLAHAHDAETREVWAKSVGRADVFTSLIDAGKWSLDGPLAIKSGSYNVTLE